MSPPMNLIANGYNTATKMKRMIGPLSLIIERITETSRMLSRLNSHSYSARWFGQASPAIPMKRRQVDFDRPDDRDKQVSRIEYRPSAILRTEELEERVTHRQRTADLIELLLPAFRFSHAVANECDEQCRRSSNREHSAPAEARAYRVIRDSRQKNPEVVAGVHVAGGHLAAVFGPLFGDECSPHRPLASDTDARQQPKQCKLPHARRDCSEKSEQRVAEDRQHQRAHTAEFVGDRSPHKRESPADQEQREQKPAIESNIRLVTRDAGTRQEFLQRGHHHQRVDERVHPVEGPASPRGPESSDLVLG